MREIYRLLKLSRARSGVARSRLFRIMDDRIPRHRRRGVAPAGGDGPLRDTFTNRDINTKRSFIFFYAPLRPRRRPRILTRPSRDDSPSSPCAAPVKIPVTLLPLRRRQRRRPLCPRFRSYGFTLGFPRTIYVAEPPLAAPENFMTTSCSLYIRVPPIRATPRIDHVFGRYIYARARIHAVHIRRRGEY